VLQYELLTIQDFLQSCENLEFRVEIEDRLCRVFQYGHRGCVVGGCADFLLDAGTGKWHAGNFVRGALLFFFGKFNGGRSASARLGGAICHVPPRSLSRSRPVARNAVRCSLFRIESVARRLCIVEMTRLVGFR